MLMCTILMYYIIIICRNRQGIFCRLMTLTGQSQCGFSFYTIVYLSRTLALVGSERRVRLNVFFEVQQMVGGGRQDGGFKRRKRRQWFHTPPPTRRGQIGIWYTVYFHAHCRFLFNRWYNVSQDIHRRLKWFQLGRHFIVNSLLLFIRLTAPRRCCRNRQDIFCRLLALTGRSRCGFSFYLILHM